MCSFRNYEDLTTCGEGGPRLTRRITPGYLRSRNSEESREENWGASEEDRPLRRDELTFFLALGSEIRYLNQTELVDETVEG
jgi:hypothetical protein